MPDRILDVMTQVLGVAPANLGDDDGPHTIEAWDSLAHVNLVLALETEFQVALSPEDAAEMLSVGAVRALLAERGAAGLSQGPPEERPAG